MLDYNTLFVFALIFGALIAIGSTIAITIINAVKEKDLIRFYKIGVAYTENGTLKMCEVPVAVQGIVMPIRKMSFVDSCIQEHLEVKLKVYNSNPVIVSMNYFGKMKEKEFKRLHKEVTLVGKGIG